MLLKTIASRPLASRVTWIEELLFGSEVGTGALHVRPPSFDVVEAERGEVTAVTKIRRRVPVEDYLKPQKRFAHLFGNPGRPDMLAKIQADMERDFYLDAEEAKAYGLIDQVITQRP